VKFDTETVLKVLIAFLLSTVFVVFLFPVILFLTVWGASFIVSYAFTEAVYDKLKGGKKWVWK